jgi:hypothetical protein
MNNKILLVCIAATLILGGCDWVRSRLDMPTSKDIAAKKALIVKREMQLDSQRNAKLDSSAVKVRDSASNAKAIAEAEADDAQLEAQQKEVQAKMAQQQQAAQQQQLAKQQAAPKQQMVAQPAAPQQQTANVDVAQTQLKYRYYLIVGSYRQAASVEKRLRQLRNMEASPVAIPLKNGLTMVSAVGFNSLSDAKAAVSDVADLAPDAWVYSRASGLHK